MSSTWFKISILLCLRIRLQPLLSLVGRLSEIAELTYFAFSLRYLVCLATLYPVQQQPSIHATRKLLFIHRQIRP